MKIVFTGAQGTGKTTVLNELFALEPFKNKFEKKTNLVRDFLKTRPGLVINEKTSQTNQELFEQAMLESFSQSTNFISDRFFFDVLAYTQYASEQEGHIPTQFFMEQLNRVESHIKECFDWKKDLLVYFPVEFPLVLDGVRSPNLGFQKAIDKNIENFLKTSSLIPPTHTTTYITVTGKVENRVAQILKAVETLHPQKI